jgi:hypothetical protein
MHRTAVSLRFSEDRCCGFLVFFKDSKWQSLDTTLEGVAGCAFRSALVNGGIDYGVIDVMVPRNTISNPDRIEG